LCAAALFAATDVDPKLYLDDVKYLASEQLRGRGNGTPELEKAAEFIAGKFAEFGLKPLDGSYLQAFPVITNAKLGGANHLKLEEGKHSASIRFPDDFVPIVFSSAGKLHAGVVFAGFGVTAKDANYDDYAGIDAKGKWVLILRHEPQESRRTANAQFSSKLSNAKMHGAAGVLMINDTALHPNDTDTLSKFGGGEGDSDLGIPFLQLKADTVRPWFQQVHKDLDRIETEIDKQMKPQSFAFPETVQADAEVDIQREVKTVHNVIGYLPGTTDEYVVLGAHYDHLGMGGAFSLKPDVVAIHPGADDNASGTSGVIELARWFSHQPQHKRGIVFMTFAGEELGLFGSAYWVAHPELPLDKAVAMVNMDMIGRIREGKVYIGGVATGSTFRPMLDQITPKYNLKIDYAESDHGSSSDHTSFHVGKIPALFFFSGLHGDYHKPSDTADKIDGPDAAKLLDLVADVVDTLRDADTRPQYVRVAPPSPGPISSSGGGSGYGPWFGSIPDFGEGIKGVKFADVRDGSPAAKAGFVAGDIMVEFDGKPITNLYDFTYALQSKKPGDEVNVKVLRDGKPVVARVLLTKRP
jgi:hypothetical protein